MGGGPKRICYAQSPRFNWRSRSVLHAMFWTWEIFFSIHEIAFAKPDSWEIWPKGVASQLYSFSFRFLFYFLGKKNTGIFLGISTINRNKHLFLSSRRWLNMISNPANIARIAQLCMGKNTLRRWPVVAFKFKSKRNELSIVVSWFP